MCGERMEYMIKNRRRSLMTDQEDMEMQSNGMMNPNHVAYMVDCYLAQKKFHQTRNLFRQEAYSALSNLVLDDVVPEGLMTLEAILDEYVRLKRQKEMMYQQRHQLVQERNKIVALFQGMQQAMNAYNSGTAVRCVPLAPPQPSSMEISPSTYANGITALPAGDPSHTSMISVFAPAMVNREPANFSAAVAGSLSPRKRSRNITEESRPRKKPHNPLPSHQMSDKDEDLRVASTSTNLTNVQMKVHQSSPQSNHMCVGPLTQMASATTAQSTKPPKSGSLNPRTLPGAAFSQSNQSTSTPNEATPQDDAPPISADIPSMTNNGEPSIDTSHSPTSQNVDNEGRNASEPEHVGLCDSALPCVSCLFFNDFTSTFDEATPLEAEPTSSVVFSSMTNNGQLDIDGSAPPTEQTVFDWERYSSDSSDAFWNSLGFN